MKHVIRSLSIGAFVLLSSTAVVLAANPHTATGTKGQPGTAQPTGVACGGVTAVGGAPIASAPGNGNVANAVNSPYGSSPPAYAGSPGNPTYLGGVGNPAHAVSEYDVACFQAP